MVVLAWLFFAASSGDALADFSKGPYIQFPAPDTVTIIWEGSTDHPAAVDFGPGASFDRRIEGVQPTPMKSETSDARGTTTYYLYKTSITGLQPGAVYSYRAEAAGAQSRKQTFRTLDPGAGHTRFIVYGDSRSDPRMHMALTRNFARHAPEFILHTGDLVARGKDYSLWSREFFIPTADIIDHLPFFSVIGNHEQDGTNYLNYFDLPGKELWYSFDSGPVHVLALDFRYSKSTDEQYRYAREDLKRSTAPWKIVIVHTPMFNIGGHASNWGHDAYLPLFHEAKVDLVLSGHSHLYERFRPLVSRRSRSNWAITHITTGGGGAGLHTTMRHPALVVQETTNHFMRFEATLDTLRGVAIRVDGSIIDHFELSKPGGKQTANFLSSAYPEESLNLYFPAIAALTAKIGGIPTPAQSVDVQFTVLPMKNSTSPARLEVSLAPDSARFYELPGGPLRITTPLPGHTNVFLTKIRATGQSPITEKSKELLPPVVFQAEVRSAQGATLSYGGKGRLAELTKPVPAPARSDAIPVRSPKHAGRH